MEERQMYIGQTVIIRHNNNLLEAQIIEIFPEDLSLQLQNGDIITRKMWEIHRIDLENED